MLSGVLASFLLLTAGQTVGESAAMSQVDAAFTRAEAAVAQARALADQETARGKLLREQHEAQARKLVEEARRRTNSIVKTANGEKSPTLNGADLGPKPANEPPPPNAGKR